PRTIGSVWMAFASAITATAFVADGSVRPYVATSSDTDAVPRSRRFTPARRRRDAVRAPSACLSRAPASGGGSDMRGAPSTSCTPATLGGGGRGRGDPSRLLVP